MKTLIFCFALIASLTASHADAAIIAGPISNPANGHDYYLLAPGSWSAAEAEAEEMGGNLAVIRNKDAQSWVYSTFGNFDDVQRGLWIGLHRKSPGGEFVWVDGTSLDYTDWYPNEPNNAGGRENCAHMRWDPAMPGTWNDSVNESQYNGVVEVPHPSAKTLKAERALIGTWYLGGSPAKRCYFADGGNVMFAINESDYSGRVFSGKGGELYVAPWQVRGQVSKDKILWSNGTWWSRHPVASDAAVEFLMPEDLKKAAGPPVDYPILN